MAWVEDRAPWRHDPKADQGAKTEGGRHEAALSFPVGIGTKAVNRLHLFLCAVCLISQPRFLHFTLNHDNRSVKIDGSWEPHVRKSISGKLAFLGKFFWCICHPRWL